MAFDNAKRILTNEDARIASSAEGIYDDDLVVLFWENVEAHHIDECVRYLNSTGQRVVSSGTTFYDVTFDDALHHLHAYYQETDQRIYRVLMRSSITTSSITQSDTKWRLQSGETYEAGTSNLVLAMYNVDPNSIVSLETESLNETYTSIYLLGGTELTGTWFNVARESEYNSQTGLYDLRWYISRYQTKEYIFATKGDQIRNVVDFFKHHMTASAIDDFESNYYFDSATLGDYYYSTDGTNYTKKNDVAATGTLPTTAKNITTEVSGRSVSYEQRPDRENGEVDIFLKLIFNQVLYATANSDLQEYTETVLRTRNASSVDSVGTPADGTQVIIEATVNDDGTFDVVKRTRTYIEQTATSGLSNAFTAESVVITTNASSHAAAPADQADGTIVRSESEQLPNGKFRNIVRTTVARTDVADVTDESTTGNDSGAGFTETTVKKYNQASAETVGADEDAAGTTVIVENTINEDGTFNTIKRTRVEREAQAASGTKGVLSSEAVVITNNAASALAQASSTTAGTTKIHESQQLENGLFRNIQRTITSHANDGSTDKVDQTGSSETILRKYNQATALAHDASEEADGTTITIENTINADGTFNTVKRTRVDSQLSATSGSANNNFTETKTVTINASAAAGSPSHEDGKIKINESEQLENGLFRNIEIVRTFSAISDITDKQIVGTEAVDGGGYTETVTKQYKQSSALAHDTNEDAAGRTITIENTIREDGTFDIVKRVRDERNQEARADSESAASTTVIQIENNAPQELGQLTEALQPDPGVTVTQESIPLDNGLFRNIKTTVTAKSQTALNKTISGKDPHLFFNGYNSYLEFENTQYQQQQKIGTYLIDFEFPEDYKPICIADGLGDFDLNNAEPLSNKVYLFSTIDGEFLGESTIDQDYLRNAVHVYLRTGEISDRNDGVSGDATSEDQLNIYLVIKVRHDEYPQGELSKTVKWNHGQRRIRIAYSADCLGYTSYEFGRRPRFAIENVAGTGTPTAAYNTASDIIIDNTNPGVTIDHVNAKNHTMFPFRVGSGYYGGDSETSGSTDAEQVSLRSEKFLLYSFHYYNCYLEDTDLQAWCDSKTLPAFQPTLSIDPSLGSNVIDSQIKDIALKEEYRQGRTIEAGEPYRIEDLGSGSTAITENSGVNSTSDYQYYPGRAQVIIPESETSNTGDRTSYFIDSASRAGNTITINLSSAHGKTGTWVTTQPNARIVVVGLSGAGGDAGAMTVNPNKKYDSASGAAVTITFTDTDTLTIQDTGISDSGSETYTLKEFRTAVVGSWFKAAVDGSLGNSVIVAPDYIPDTTRFHNATVIGDVFVAGGSREETVEVNTSNTEQKFITDGGTVADPKSGEEKSIVNEVLPDGKYRTIITTRKSKLQSAVSEVSSDSESSTTTINLRNVKQETAEASVPGKIVTVENTPNEDGTFRTSKTITTAKSQLSIAGSTNALRSESILIYNNASSTLGAPADQNDGTILIHESEELPNGLYRNVIRSITSRTDVANVEDKIISGDDSGAGYTEVITKKYNQASAETAAGEDAAGKTIIIENTINEDGKYNTIKRVRTDRSTAATAISKSAGANTTVVITNNDNAAATPSDPAAGTTVVTESIPLENGKFRNVVTTTTAANITGSTDLKVGGTDAYSESTEILTSSSEKTFGSNSADQVALPAAGQIKSISNEPLADGKFRTVVTTRNIADKEYFYKFIENEYTIKTEIVFKNVDKGTKDNLLEQIKLDNTGDYYQVVPNGQNKKNGENYNDTIPATALLVSETYTGNDASTDHDDRKVLVGLSCNEETNLWTLVINAEFYSSGNANKKWMPTSTDDSAMTSSAFQAQLDKRTTMNVWLAFNLSYEEATSFGDKFYNSGSVGNGITRNVSDPIPKPNGRFDIKVIEIRKQELVQKFRVGNTFHFYGFHHSKRPITTGTAGSDEIKITSDNDDDYNLGDTDFGQFIGDVKEEDDGTFSWYFKYTRPVSRKTGANEASASDTSIGSDSIASFGDFHEEVQWKGSYQDREYANNRNLLGVYNNRTIGYHQNSSTYTVTGCSFYKDEIRNEFIDRNTGRLNYDVYRYLYRSEINGEDDDWFLVSSTEAFDRKRTTLATLTTTGNVALNNQYHKYSTMGTVGGASPSYNTEYEAGTPFNTQQDANGNYTTLHHTGDRDEHADQTKTLISGDVGGDGTNTATDYTIPTFHSIESVTKRRKTVSVYRKFFVRRPTKADLQARAFNSPSSNSEKVSIYDVMTKTSDPEADADTKLARSFRVVKISKYNYAIEMREVRQSVVHSYDMDNITRIVSQETLPGTNDTTLIKSISGLSVLSDEGILRVESDLYSVLSKGDIVNIHSYQGSAETSDGIRASINGNHIVEGIDSDDRILIKIPRISSLGYTNTYGGIKKYKARLCTGYQEIVGGHFRASSGMLEDELNSDDTFKDPVHGEMN